MVSIKNVRLFYNTPNGIFKISLCLTLMVFVLTMTPASTFLQITKPAEAAPLTSIKISPTNNIVNTRTTYDIFFVTATTGTIKFIQMTFPSGFSVDTATLIERSGIGTGSISTPSANQVIYSVTNPVSVPAGTSIRLQIAKILNSNTEGSFRVSIATQDANNVIIDGPTNSFSFPIKAIGTNDISDNGVTTADIADNSITDNDISTGLMIRKTLLDNDVGHAHGWDPDGADDFFTILEPDLIGDPNGIFVSVVANGGACVPSAVTQGAFSINCFDAPTATRSLEYIITNMTSHVVTASASASPSPSPFDSTQGSQNVFPPSLP